MAHTNEHPRETKPIAYQSVEIIDGKDAATHRSFGKSATALDVIEADYAKDGGTNEGDHFNLASTIYDFVEAEQALEALGNDTQADRKPYLRDVISFSDAMKDVILNNENITGAGIKDFVLTKYNELYSNESGEGAGQQSWADHLETIESYIDGVLAEIRAEFATLETLRQHYRVDRPSLNDEVAGNKLWLTLDDDEVSVVVALSPEDAARKREAQPIGKKQVVLVPEVKKIDIGDKFFAHPFVYEKQFPAMNEQLRKELDRINW